MTNYNDGKWHGWNGGKCPVNPESVVDVTYAYGEQSTGDYAKYIMWDEPLLFRVVKAAKESRTFWLVVIPTGMFHFDNEDRAREHRRKFGGELVQAKKVIDNDN